MNSIIAREASGLMFRKERRVKGDTRRHAISCTMLKTDRKPFLLNGGSMHMYMQDTKDGEVMSPGSIVMRVRHEGMLA